MRILMLDHNWLIDRRIVLMVESLLKLGHEAKILYVDPPASFSERMDTPVEAIPFPDSDNGVFVGGGVLDQPPHVREALNPWRRDTASVMAEQQARVDRLRDANGHLRGVNRLKAALVAPRVVRKMWDELPGQGPAHGVVSAGLGLLARLQSPWLIQEPKTPSPEGRTLRHWDKGVLRFARSSWTPDIVVANDYPTLRAAVAIKQTTGARLIFDAHELYSYQPNVAHQHARDMFAEERRLLKWVDGLIVVNQQHGEVMKRDSAWTGRMAACANATRVPADFDIHKRYDLIRARTGIPADHKIMLFQGGINTARRIDYILKGLAQSRRRDVHMVFLTFGGEIPQFRRMAEGLGIGKRVHFLPFVPWEDVVYWAASADVGFMPYAARDQNTVISSPNKMYEFIMAGTPMIGPWDLVNVRNIVGGEGFGVVLPLREVQDYARAIDTMFDPALGGPERFRAALIEKAHKYDWEEESRAAMELYGEVSKLPSSRLPARTGAAR